MHLASTAVTYLQDIHVSSQRISGRKKQDCHHNAWDAVETPSKHINLTDFENADHLNHPSFRYLFLEMRDIAKQKVALSQVLLAFYVGITTKPTPVWSTEPLRVWQDLNLLNPSLLIPTWFPVEWSWPILAQTLYMELEAPPVPRTPLCCIFPGPRGPIIWIRSIAFILPPPLTAWHNNCLHDDIANAHHTSSHISIKRSMCRNRYLAIHIFYRRSSG